MTEFQILQDDWVKIAPVGDFDHEFGIQRFDREAIASLAERFNSFISRLGRLFAGAPTFRGHPDTNPEKYPDTMSYGWIMELKDRGEEGLWGRMKWTEEGRELVRKGHFKFVSPVVRGVEIGRENGRIVYRPQSLLSLGLTNTPNLPLPPLANENLITMKKLTEILKLEETASAEQICEAAELLANALTTERKRAEEARARSGLN